MPDVAAGSGHAAAFDAQAAGYDARTGLPPGVSEAVAEAVVRLGVVSAEDLVLEIGAGTGEIGAYLAALAPRYLGFDASPAMLQVFRARAAPGAPRLLVADGDDRWPVPDGGVRVVFASRVIHLLDPDHIVREATRVSQPGGYVMLGRVHRDPDGLKERLRRRRQQVLRETGIQPRSGDAGARQVIARLTQAGWTDQGRHSVAAWTDASSAGEIIAEWDTLTRMGSVEVDGVTRARILGTMREWAEREFGELDRTWPFREEYVLDIAQRPERQHA